jgi:hypothetical protein
MKIGGVLALSLFLFWQGSSFGQVDQVRIQKEWGEMDFAPCIAGYHDGEIPIDRICDARGLYTKRGLNIVSFTLEIQTAAYDTLLRVAGNDIPDTICALIQREGLRKHYYFTRIRAVDLDGSIKHLSPMHLVTIRKEDE